MDGEQKFYIRKAVWLPRVKKAYMLFVELLRIRYKAWWTDFGNAVKQEIVRRIVWG